jgi:putative ABC transport system permease protein
MNVIREWCRRVWYLVNRSRFEATLQEEMEAHRAAMADPARFGDLARIRERSRDVWGWRWLDEVLRDARFACRTLARSPGFALAAVASLAIGFALTTSTIAVVNAYLIRAMPFPAADRLYHVIYAPQGRPEPRGVTDFDWTALSDVVEHVDASAPARFYIIDGSSRHNAGGLAATAESLEMLGVTAVVGRSLTKEDFRLGAEPVVLIGHALWREQFGSDPHAIGQLLRATRSTLADPVETFRIVGVLPANYRYPREYARGDTEFVVPRLAALRVYFVRLREHVPVAAAERRITDAIKALAAPPPDWAGVRLESVRDRYVAGLRPMLMAVTAAAALVLVVVSVNVAVLLLLRAMRREKEVAVRVALGASAGHIVRMLTVETCVLCLVSLGCGLALTRLTLGALAPSIEQRLGRGAPGGTAAISLDATVLLAIGAIGLVIALGLSLTPLRISRRIAHGLHRHGRSATDAPAMRRLRSGLVAMELAVSLALLSACGLMVRTVVNLLRTDLGYEIAGVVRGRIALPPRTYPDDASLLRFYTQFMERWAGASNAPVTLTNFIPLYDTPRQAVEVADRDTTAQTAGVLAVTDGYFAMFRIPLAEGRAFSAADRDGSEPVAIVSRTLARQLWPEGHAVGRRIRTAVEPVPGSPLADWRTVIGVAADVRQTYTDADRRDIYVPFMQAPSRYAPVYVRRDGPSPARVEDVRTMIAAMDPAVLVTGETPLAVESDRLLAQPRFLLSVFAAFAVFATLLAMLGIHAVTAYAAQQREREVAIRMALGATRDGVVRMFLRESRGVLAAGTAAGLFGAAAVARTLEQQLQGVRPFDLATTLTTCVVVLAASLLATWWPARRAASKNPVVALNES